MTFRPALGRLLRDRPSLLLLLGTLLLGLLALSRPVPAESAGEPARYLLVGGGSRPAMTQASLETHLDQLRRTLELPRQAEAGGGLHGTLLFGAGPGPFPVVLEEQGQPPRVRDELRELLAEIYGQDGGLQLRYRPTHLEQLAGPAGRAELLAALRREAGQLGPEGTLFFYFTGHGSVEQEPAGPTLWLWGDETLGLKDLAAALDEQPAPPQVVLVLTQCFAGSFAPLLYRGGDPARGPAEATRCGFFATLGDREATGCTPSQAREHYDDYTVRLVEALRGRTLSGQAASSPTDLDGDGRVGLDEAHSYARLHERSVDVPTCTSELWLRERATTPGTLHLGSPLAALLAAARPAERAVVAGLSTRLFPGDTSPVLQARYRSELAEQQIRRTAQAYEEAARQRESAAHELLVDLSARWPILEEPWHLELPELLRVQGPAILRLLRSHPALEEMRKAEELAGELDERRWELMASRAWFERLVRAAENTVLEAALRSSGEPGDVEVLDRLLACEAWVPGDAAGRAAARVAGP